LAQKKSKDFFQENQENREHGCSWSGSGWHSSAARIVTFRRSDRGRPDRKIRTNRFARIGKSVKGTPKQTSSQSEARTSRCSESSWNGRGKPVCRFQRHFTSKRPRNLGHEMFERTFRVRRSTAIGVSEKAREIPHRISKRFFWRCRSNENFISKVSNHRKNKGFELLPGLEPWAVPAARQETSDMGFTFAMKALPAGKARRVSRVR